jgi:hypothetical protein
LDLVALATCGVGVGFVSEVFAGRFCSVPDASVDVVLPAALSRASCARLSRCSGIPATILLESEFCDVLDFNQQVRRIDEKNYKFTIAQPCDCFLDRDDTKQVEQS